MILNTDKLGSKGYILHPCCKFDVSISIISSLRDTGKQMERGVNIIEDLTFKLCQLRKT
jgi:hypothetical protein